MVKRVAIFSNPVYSLHLQNSQIAISRPPENQIQDKLLQRHDAHAKMRVKNVQTAQTLLSPRTVSSELPKSIRRNLHAKRFTANLIEALPRSAGSFFRQPRQRYQRPDFHGAFAGHGHAAGDVDGGVKVCDID